MAAALMYISILSAQVCYYLEITCSSKQEQAEIRRLLHSQQWLSEENILENGQSVLMGPYDLSKAQELKEKLERELSIVANLSIAMLEGDFVNNIYTPLDEPIQSEVIVQDTDIVELSYGKEVTTDTLKLYSDEKVRKIISLALEFYTVPYKWGGTNVESGIDCSFFVKYIFKKVGINLPRTSREQFKIGEVVEKSELQPGDLVFFKKVRYRKVRNKIKKYEYINHVGIYLKDGEFIHAARSARKVIISSLEEPYYKKHYAGARRVIKNGI